MYAELHTCIGNFSRFKCRSQAQVPRRNTWTASHINVPALNVSLFLCVTPFEQRLCGLEEQHRKADTHVITHVIHWTGWKNNVLSHFHNSLDYMSC